MGDSRSGLIQARSALKRGELTFEQLEEAVLFLT